MRMLVGFVRRYRTNWAGLARLDHDALPMTESVHGRRRE
jgi:hypothetical protein